MRKFLTILFFPLICFGRIPISPTTQGGQTAVSLDLRIVNYTGGSDCNVYYGFFNDDGYLIPGAEGNLYVSGLITSDIQTALVNTVGSVDSWVMDMNIIYDDRYKFRYYQSSIYKFIELDQTVLTQGEYNNIRGFVFDQLNLNSPTVDATIVDDGYYNGFFFPARLSDGRIISVYKKSTTHAAKGPFTFAQSFDGGSSWEEFQIIVNGSTVECAALSLGVLSSGRILIGYQDDELYTSMKLAYSDNNGVSFVGAGTITFGSGYSSSPSPVKMVVMPSGKIYCAYYKFGTGGNPAIVGLLESTDNGESWSFGPQIFSHAGTGFGDDKGHEVAFCISDNTGTDATCKMIALIRDADQGSVYMHYTSSDGGATWTTDLINSDAGPGGPFARHYLYAFGSSSGAQPVDMILKDGYIWVVCGLRAASGYVLTWIKATAANAFVNIYSDWSARTDVLTFNAYTLGSDVDCGYPLFFIDHENKLWVHYYDVSTEPNTPPPTTTDRVWGKQKKIAD